MKQASANAQAKRAAGEAAARMISTGMTVGVGTGSTAMAFTRALAERARSENLEIEVVPTSFQSRILCSQSGFNVVDPTFVRSLDVCVDGADQVDRQLNAIKGGGACHTVEKVIAALADRYVLVIDDSKLVNALGDGFPVPVEVLPVALGLVTREIERLGYACELRPGSGKDGPVTSDSGNLILDIETGPIDDPIALGRALDSIPGLIGHGLFTGMAHAVVIGRVSDGEATVDVVTL